MRMLEAVERDTCTVKEHTMLIGDLNDVKKCDVSLFCTLCAPIERVQTSRLASELATLMALGL
jgi:hypothetical protein